MSRVRHLRLRGFSLLELSVALVVVSLVVGFGVTGGRNAVEGSSRVATQQRLETIQKALDGFARLNGYLPCPSQRALTPTSTSFGIESRSGTSCNVTGDIKNVPAAPSTPVVYIGAVPVRTLGLPDSYAADSWSNKFLYAVSQNHVGSPNSYATADGTITIKYGNRTGTNYALTTDRAGAPGPAATYIVVSHGPDGKGAYPLIGTAAAKPCTTVTNKENDIENCDQVDATFYDSAYNEGSNASVFFDDYVVWGSNALLRSPIAQDTASISGTCLSSGGTACDYNINTVGSAPDCDTICSNAGYSSSGASVSNCTYSAGCAQGGHLSCSYQCCCSGTPPQGCDAVTGTTWGSGNCAGDVPVLAHGATTTVLNALPGYSGQETATCTSGTVNYSAASCNALAPTSSSTSSASSTSTSSSTGGRAGCSTGNCNEWCAPCQKVGNLRIQRQLCEKFLVSENPCQAACVYSGCGCFIGETLITMADGSKKPIAELKLGDKLQGETQINTLIRPETHRSTELLYSINGESAFVTGEHLLMTTKGWRAIDPKLVVLESKGKKTAEQLVVGDMLVLEGGKTKVVTSIKGEMRKDMVLYNPGLDGDHTYYANGILVHNLKMGAANYGCWGCP